MLAPMIIGTALCKVIDPEATSATTSEVVVELLCNIAVIRSPMNRPVNGLEVANKMVSATFLPKCCRDDVIKSRENKNKINAPSIYTPMRTLDHTFFFGSIIGACSKFVRVARGLYISLSNILSSATDRFYNVHPECRRTMLRSTHTHV